MKSTVFALLTISLFLFGCQKDNIHMSQVKVWNEDFQVIRSIDDSGTLGELKMIWEDRTEVSPSERPSFTHKVDIATAQGSTRWLYDPNGYATVLSKAKMPIYHFTNPEKLNKILIPQQDSPADADKTRR